MPNQSPFALKAYESVLFFSFIKVSKMESFDNKKNLRREKDLKKLC